MKGYLFEKILQKGNRKNLKVIIKNIVHILTQHGVYTYNKHALIERYTIFGKEKWQGIEKEKNNKR